MAVCFLGVCGSSSASWCCGEDSNNLVTNGCSAESCNPVTDPNCSRIAALGEVEVGCTYAPPGQTQQTWCCTKERYRYDCNGQVCIVEKLVGQTQGGCLD